MQRSRRTAAVLAGAIAPLCLAATSAVAAPTGYVSDYETYTTVAATKVYAKPGGSKDNQFLFTISPKGAAVDITCWRYGSTVAGDRVWYYLWWMSSGYVVEGFAPGADVATGHDPNPHVRPC